MKPGGDNRYANHHYHPSTVTNDGVLSTLDCTLHKDLIRRIYGSVSRDIGKVYVNVPLMTMNDAYISEDAVFRKALNMQEAEERKVSDRKRKASDKLEKEADRERNFTLSLTPKQLTEYEEIKENFIKQTRLLSEREKNEIARRLDEAEASLQEELSSTKQLQIEREEDDERDLITIYGGLNKLQLAQCCIKIGNFKGAIKYASEALSKCQLRLRHLSRLQVDYNSFKDFSLIDLRYLLVLNPSDKEALRSN